MLFLLGKEGRPLYILRDEITDGRVAMVITLLLFLGVIGAMIRLGVGNLLAVLR